MLARIYGEHGQRLLERNVRAFLQAKGKINKGLQKTLKEEPHRFLAYNSLRAQTVAFALAWLVEKSGRKIDLNQIWEKQSVSDALADAIVAVGVKALAFIKSQPGNPTEAAKKEDCWLKFRSTKFDLDPTWEKAWSEHAFEAPRSDMEAVEQEWERIRQKFLGDQRSIMGLAVRMGREYPNSTGGLITGQVAALSWEKLKMKPGFGPKKLRQIVELFSAAIGRTKT